jgi:hypothetical protein
VDSSRTPQKINFLLDLAPFPHPKNNYFFPSPHQPRRISGQKSCQFSLPDSFATKGQKLVFTTSQVHACLHVSLLSPINPICSITPLLPPRAFPVDPT